MIATLCPSRAGGSPRRFPPPWTVEEHNDSCFIVRDATGQALGYFYFEDEPGRRAAAGGTVTDVTALPTAALHYEIEKCPP